MEGKAKEGGEGGKGAKGEGKEGGAHAAKEGGAVEGGGGGGGGAAAHAGGAAHGAEHAEHAGGEGGHQVSAEAGRELIEQELSFHDRWKVYQGGAGSRAGHLARTLFYADGGGSVASNIWHSDVAQGVFGGALWAGGGKVGEILGSKIPVPGIANIVGAGFSGYILYAHGKDMVKGAVHGIGGAFSAKNWSDAPFATAANLVEGICQTLELIGHVCNILSGLAYAFSAIAAIGGLLSFFFPPLAFLVPYIPVAINFARACSGIASAALAVTYLLSPVVAILRALHQIFSDQDPAKLAEEEDEYHSATSGAIACYSASKFSGESFVGGNVEEVKGGIATYRGAMGGGVAPTAGNFKSGTDNVRQAIGGDRSAAEVSKDYFHPERQTAVAERSKEGQERKLDKEEHRLSQAEKDRAYVEGRANKAQERLDNNPTQENFNRSVKASETAERHDVRVGERQAAVTTQQGNVEQARIRTQVPSARQGLGEGDFGGELGDGIETAVEDAAAAPDARKKKLANTAAEEIMEDKEGGEPGGHGEPGEHGEGEGGGGGGSGEPGEHGGGGDEHHVEAQHDAKGHIILPEPPGSLQQIDEIDQAIDKVEHDKQQQHDVGIQARAKQHEAQQRSKGLQHLSGDVRKYVATKQAKSQVEQAKVHAQTADMQAKSAQAHGKTAQGGNQASLPMRGIAAGARTVDGLVQRIPSNKFFDISSAKTNVHQFVVGMDTVMGVGSKNEESKGKTQALINDRNQQTQAAAAKHQQASAQGHGLAAEINADATEAHGVGTKASGLADEATAAEQQSGSKLAELKAERQQKWQALTGWAAQHRTLREQATKEH